MGAIQVGKAIYSLLSSNTGITAYVSTRIFPLVIPENQVLPCIVYDRSVDIEYTCDGAGMETTGVEITVLSEDYEETINISQAIFNTLSSYRGTVGTLEIRDIKLTGIYETYAENSYIQQLTFMIKSV